MCSKVTDPCEEDCTQEAVERPLTMGLGASWSEAHRSQLPESAWRVKAEAQQTTAT
jgi:hypothetical protein